MRRYVCLSIFAGLFLSLSMYARAQDSETIDDVRCVVVGLKMGGTEDASQQSAALMLTLYYIGRIDGRVPKLDFETLLAKETVKMTPTEFKNEAKRCGGHLSLKGEQITKIGKDMTELGQKMLDKNNTPSN
jgi:hypothetical protein